MSQSSPPPQQSFVIPETPHPQVSSPLQIPINSPPVVIVYGTPSTTVQKPTQLVQGAMPSPQRLFDDDNGSGNGSGNVGGSGRRKSTLLLKRIKSKSKSKSKRKSNKRKVQKKKTRRSRYN